MANAQGHRHIARRLAVQALYQWEITGGALADVAALESRFLTDASPKTYDVDYFRKLIREIPVNSDYLDELIKDYLDRPIDKVDVVERAVLRLAVWEMTREPEVPDAVAINEAVELAKLFGSDHSYRFVNGVLDKFKTSQAAIDDSGAIGAPVPGGGEFALINTYFKRTGPQPPAVVVGIGDDAAVIAPPPDQQLVVTVDTMVSGVHFSADADPHSLGHKLMAVNLSDLAAMGATPAWATLALTMPEVDAAWLSAFAGGLFAMADQYGVALAGGDTTQGPLTLTLQLGGSIPRRGALLRSGAQSGDGIYVTGTLGDAGLGLRILREECDAGEHNDFLVTRLQRPQPRVQAGLALRGTAHSAIDISDGLCQDLGHVLTASGVGATIDVDALPLSSAYRALLDEVGHLPALTSGDDYELLFTLKDSRSEVLANLGIVATRIGDIEAQPGLRFRGQSASDLAAAIQDAGYQHFLTPGTVGGAA